MNPVQAAFERLYALSDDPWQFRTRWYEARKRELLLAALPGARYRSGYEPGCGNGELAAGLAARCDRLLVTDGVAAAVGLARARVAAQPHVDVREAWLPRDWPRDEPFDLIVVSEIGFYLTRQELAELARAVQDTLLPDGVLVACHWRHPVDGFELDGDTVHRVLGEHLDWPLVVEHVEPDLRLDIWRADGRSVASIEGLI